VDPKKTLDITEGSAFPVTFSYSVKWHATQTRFADRMDRYSRYSFLPQHLEVRGGCVRACARMRACAAQQTGPHAMVRTRGRVCARACKPCIVPDALACLCL
jgi:hypothetical protein